MARARAEDATLLIARLDRLSRNAAFTMGLRDSGVDFVAVDMPEVDRFAMGVLAMVNEKAAEDISRNTRAALAQISPAARERRRANGGKHFNAASQEKSRRAKRALALARHNGAVAIAKELHARGANYSQIARTLNDGDHRTMHGKLYSAVQVRRILTMAGAL
jgi:DNA invertase Pin-like site-specific DNA recombinase